MNTPHTPDESVETSDEALTPEDITYLRGLRDRGFAVSVFTPGEMPDSSQEDVEDAMVAGGWDKINADEVDDGEESDEG